MSGVQTLSVNPAVNSFTYNAGDIPELAHTEAGKLATVELERLLPLLGRYRLMTGIFKGVPEK